MDLHAQLLSLSAARQQNRWGDSLTLADSILQAAPDRFPAIEARAQALSKLGRRDEALAAWNHAVGVADERLKKGLAVQPMVVSTRMARAAELALAGRDADAIADLKVAIALEPKCRTTLKKDKIFARVLQSAAGAELLTPKKVHPAGYVVELTTRAGDEWIRSLFFALGTIEEIISVLSDEFGISNPKKRAGAAQCALTLEQTFAVHVVRSSEAADPIDLHSFVEVFWSGAWHRLDADALKPLRELTFEQLLALELTFRIDEALLRDELPAARRAPLLSGEFLRVDAFEPFQGEDKVLQHGVHDAVENSFSPLIADAS